MLGCNAEHERRAAIRDSWAKHAEASKDMIIRFYVHEECSDDEEMHHHDVVCTRDLDFQDPLDRDQEGVTQRVQIDLKDFIPTYNRFPQQQALLSQCATLDNL